MGREKVTDPTEAEARAAVDELEAFIESFSRGLYERLNALGEHAKELGRAAEREKVRALLSNALETLDEYRAYNTPAGIDIRAWLARDEVPE